ncbi:MAG TPA: lipopolysaccharide assembly protein LapA domain-containing protein [Acidimicrobiales bacterium]|nr:lipopolysaccharide assembly protein LapA domain-containing protein [Acidimicrobiales bacterium]
MGVALVDFIVQNTRSVRVAFFGANGHIPVAVALLAAAVAGGLVVMVAGVARTTQMRMAARRLGQHNRHQGAAPDPPIDQP